MHPRRMQARELERLDKSLEGFLAKLTAGLGRSERRRWAGVYVRGLLLDGERKSIEPMASRLGESDQDLQHFVSQSPWSADVLLEALAKETARSLSDYWIIDETSFPKAGDYSAGVQRQYCGALGKKANCQIAVSLHRAGEQGGFTCRRVGLRTRSAVNGRASRRRWSIKASSISPWDSSTKRWAGRCPPGSCWLTRRMVAALSSERRCASAACVTACGCLGRPLLG